MAIAPEFYLEQSDKAYANFLHALRLFRENPTDESIEDCLGAYRWVLVTERQLHEAGQRGAA